MVSEGGLGIPWQLSTYQEAEVSKCCSVFDLLTCLKKVRSFKGVHLSFFNIVSCSPSTSHRIVMALTLHVYPSYSFGDQKYDPQVGLQTQWTQWELNWDSNSSYYLASHVPVLTVGTVMTVEIPWYQCQTELFVQLYLESLCISFSSVYICLNNGGSSLSETMGIITMGTCCG